ncbi:MAG: hypothetical protein ACI4RC_06625 [Oscillospiraceae bacterium]
MNLNSVMKGVSAGITAGALVYAVANASRHEKRVLKSRTGKALHAISSVMDEISTMME